MGCAFSVFVLCSFPASGRKGPGAGRTSPRGPGVRMGRPDVGTGRSGHGSGRMDPRAPAGRTGGSKMKDKLPRVRFCKVRGCPHTRGDEPRWGRWGGRVDRLSPHAWG
jgi:hypothetical protein